MQFRALGLVSSLGLSLIAAACSVSGDDAAAGPPPAPQDDGSVADAGPATLTWTGCPLKSEGGGPSAECTVAQLPLRAGVDDGQTLAVHVKRYRPKGGKGLRQLWMLQGGPGGSAYVFEALVEIIGEKFPDVDYYLPDHRGTGKSSRIGCAAEGEGTPSGFFIEPDEWPGCIAEVQARLGDALGAYSTTNAANDIGVLIDRAKQPGQPAFVYGVSYGTYLAMRYMQLYPEQADGVILDSVVPMKGSLARQDQDANEAAKDFFDVCAKDAVCSSKLGPDPWAKANDVFARLKAGHCPAIANAAAPSHVLLRRAFGQFLMHQEYRRMIPPIVYRVDRCEQRDVDVLKPLMDGFVQEAPIGEMLKQWGWVLSNNITMSELWESPTPTAADLDAIREGSVASRDVTTGMDALIGKWPTYAPDRFTGGWPDRKKPVLVLQGGLDPATLLRKAREAKPFFAKPGQHWIEVPSATHTVIASSTTTAKRSCGTQMMMSFLERPESPDTSCLANVIPVGFDLPSGLVQAFFGQDDAWE